MKNIFTSLKSFCKKHPLFIAVLFNIFCWYIVLRIAIGDAATDWTLSRFIYAYFHTVEHPWFVLFGLVLAIASLIYLFRKIGQLFHFDDR